MHHAVPCHHLSIVALFVLATVPAVAQYQAERFSFEYDGLTYAGYLDYPDSLPPEGLIVLLPGHGCTSVTDGGTLASHRRKLIDRGWATALWDRAGCGDSEGRYDHSQPVEDSALEAIAALDALRALDAPGVERLGFWSVSRGGWIAPLAIARDGDVDFWISVSGPSQFENFPYMLETNVRLDGRSAAQARQVREAWLALQRLPHDPDVSYDGFIDATSAMFEDPWFRRHFDAEPPSREEFLRDRASAGEDPHRYDPDTGSPIAVADFDNTLESLDIPVLAVLGDKDSQVDWRQSRDFYLATLGRDPQSDLTLRVLPDCNHALRTARTGAWREDLSAPGLGERCPEYWPTLDDWLAARGS